MDYVKLKPKVKNKSRYIEFMRGLFLVVLGFGLGFAYQGTKLAKKKTFLLKKTTAQEFAPKLRFYDVLVNEHQYEQLALPFVLEAAIYQDEAYCRDLRGKLVKYGEKVKIAHFEQNGVKMCQVILGPYENLNAVYKVKAKFYDIGYVLSLRDNYPEEK